MLSSQVVAVLSWKLANAPRVILGGVLLFMLTGIQHVCLYINTSRG
ncbi:hypothetical protein SEA_DRHAYES_90 [Mycobacterium phage DrHayes]|uniref:Uncharacterized protein n=1 Tax=Mycobacterium phage Urkel TaxID=1912978 RepID=A0A1I9S4X1_9CAUD|nr:hypothetical protein I5H07_gp13 [Mycobacterium phage Urkel]AOZ61421.1 hypothetical protein SEA_SAMUELLPLAQSON_90 [Mycobacterium phage SamuelLPlaqson]AOZ61518.1 hypothetical protein SEA_DRHAYES_90 [Mycobacterium phage DrHayes]AOZ61615.1 hypothetical protein SEA_URKEL_90 [Mycobacterium phage Urkel]